MRLRIRRIPRQAKVSRFSAVESATRRSPDVHPVFRLEIELVAWLHAEGVVPGVDVAHGPVDTKARGRMGIARHLPLERIRPRLLAPHLRPAQEHALLACEAGEH